MQGLGLTGPLASYHRVQLARPTRPHGGKSSGSWGFVFLCGYTIHPKSRALSLAACQACDRNSDSDVGLRGSSRFEMRFARSCGDFGGL
jgi:hypothetical protein